MDPITEVPTLSEVVIRLQQDRSLSATRRRDLVSGMLRMSEITGVDPRGTPASLRVMRPLIKRRSSRQIRFDPKDLVQPVLELSRRPGASGAADGKTT